MIRIALALLALAGITTGAVYFQHGGMPRYPSGIRYLNRDHAPDAPVAVIRLDPDTILNVTPEQGYWLCNIMTCHLAALLDQSGHGNDLSQSDKNEQYIVHFPNPYRSDNRPGRFWP